MSQDMAAGSKPDPMEDPKSAMMHDPRYLPHYYSHVSDDVLGVGVHHPMDGAQMLEAPLQHGNPVVVEKTSKSSKGLSKKSTSKAAAKAALVAGESVETADGKDANKRQKHVKKACVHCKKAHLACDEERPCRRCVHLGKTDCVDVEHKRRGRPRSSPEKRPSLCVTEGTLAVIDAAAAAATAASLSTKKGRQQHATVAVKMEARQVPFDPQSYVICPTDTFSGELMGQGGVPLLAPPAE